MLKLAKHGFRAIVLLADLHALANDKGDIEEIQEFARKDREMFERVAGKLGVGGKIGTGSAPSLKTRSTL